MKIKFLITFLLLLISISFVSSQRTEPNYIYDGIIDTSGNYHPGTTLLTHVTTIGYVCSSTGCYSVSTELFGPENTGNQNPYNLFYPTTLQSSSGYLLYFFKEGYIPYAATSNLYGNGPASAQDDYLYQKQYCRSNITNLEVSGNNTLGNTINISAKVYSAILNHGPAVYRPSQYLSHFKNNVTSTLQVINRETGQAIYSVKTNLIDFSSHAHIDFNFIPTTAGNYSFNITTSSSDQKCLSSIPISVITDLEIISPPTPPIITLPIITIISPENITYNTSSILINLASINATNVWWTDGTTTYPYTTPITQIFSDGSHTIYAYANNSAGTVSTQVTFSVNTSLPPVNPPQTSGGSRCRRVVNDTDDLLVLEEIKPVRVGNNTIYFTAEESTSKKTDFSLLYLFLLLGLNLVLLIVLLSLLIKR